MSNILVVSPHPDDETLGVGGTIAKAVNDGHKVYWMIITGMTKEGGFSEEQIKKREEEIQAIAEYYPFFGMFKLNFPAASLNYNVLTEIISKASAIVREIKPADIYLPCPFDVHSDHFFVYEAMKATSKWFRFPYVKRVVCYETISETNFSLGMDGKGRFVPNIYEDITKYLDCKTKAMKIYASEVDAHPFPRSEKAIEALATLRGSECGCKYAEAFMLLKEIR